MAICIVGAIGRTSPWREISRLTVEADRFRSRAISRIVLVPAQAYVGQFLMTFMEYPQRQKAASFNLDEVMEKLKESGGSK